MALCTPAPTARSPARDQATNATPTPLAGKGVYDGDALSYTCGTASSA